MGIIQIWKKIKWARRIIALFSIISTVLGMYLWIFNVSVHAEAIDPNDIGTFDTLKDPSDSTAHTANQQAIVDKAEEIAKHYAANHYTYDKNDGPWDLHYKDSKYHVSCCSIYVIQVLVELGLTDTFGGYDCRIFIGFF